MAMLEFLKCLEMGMIFGILAIGIYLTFRVIDFPDLTCDGSFVLGAAVTASLIVTQIPPALSVPASFFAGAMAGLITAFLHQRLNVTPLLSGILVAFMLYSINLDIMRGQPNIVLMNLPTLFDNASSIGVLLLVTVIVCGALAYILSTDFGLALKSIGQNKRLAANSGVSTHAMTYVGLALSNGLIALAGSLFCQLEGFADLTLGPGTIIFGLAAVLIGEKVLPFRHVGIAITSCVVGSIVYRILVSLALHSDWLGLRTKDLNLVTGVLVLIVMQLPVMKRRKAFKGASC